MRGTLRRLVGSVRPRRAVLRVMPAAVRQSFLAKLLATIAVMLVVASVIGGVFFVGISGALDRQVDRNVRATAELHTEVYDDWFQNRQEQLSRTAQQPFVTESDSGYISDELTIAQAQSDTISDYHLVDSETGRIVGSSNDEAVGQRLYERIDASRALVTNSSRLVLPGRFRPFGDDPVLLFRVKPSYTNRLLIAEVPVDRAPALPQTFEGSTTHVLTPDGDVIVGPELDFEPTGAPSEPTVRSVNGSLYAYQQIPEQNLLLVTRTPRASAFAVKEAVLLSFGLTLVLIFAVITLVGLSGGEAAISDLTRLAEKSREMAAGNLDVELSTNREDEIGVLYESYAEMRDALRERITEAEAARQNAQAARAELAARNEDIEEQRAIISVLNRVLRHNLRNDFTVVWSHLDLIGDHVDDPAVQDHLTAVERKLDELIERADKAREIEQLTRRSDRALVAVDIRSVVETELDRFTELYPDATIEFDCGETTTARAHEAVGFVVSNLVENAIEHNDSGTPTVTVSVTGEDEWVEIRVADDGPGIHEDELASLEAGYETAIEHGSGLGLWLVNWLVDEMDGELAFGERDPSGTVVTVRLPRASTDAGRTEAELDLD